MLEDKCKQLKTFQQLSQTVERDVAHTVPEKIVFCECDHSNVDCTFERWKICNRRIQRERRAQMGHLNEHPNLGVVLRCMPRR